MSTDIENVACNSVIVPGTWPIQRGDGQKWLMTLTGIQVINFTFDFSSDSLTETFHLHLKFRPPLAQAYIHTYGQIPSGKEFQFKPEQGAPFATLNYVEFSGPSIFGPSDRAGAALDCCSLLLDTNRYFLGLSVQVTINGPRTSVFSVGFQMTMFGRIILSDIPI